MLADLAPVLAMSLYPVMALLPTSRALKTAPSSFSRYGPVAADSIGAFVDDRRGTAGWTWTIHPSVSGRGRTISSSTRSGVAATR
jgi:hypothetical protein